MTMPHLITRSQSLGRALGSIMLLGLLPLSLNADPQYTWVGPASGGDWNAAENWKVSGTPEGDRTQIALGRGGALLPSTNVNRNVIFSGATATAQDGRSYTNWLRDITIQQNAAAVNQLTLVHSLWLGNSLNLTAANGGSVVLQMQNIPLDNAGQSQAGENTPALRFEMGYKGEAPRSLSVAENGILDFSGTIRNKGNAAVVISRGTINVNGGRVLLREGIKEGKENSIVYTVSSDLNIRNGEIVFGAPALGGRQHVADVRMSVGGTFTMTSGRLVNPNPKSARQLWLSGEKNFILDTAAVDPGISIVLGRNADQEMISGSPIGHVQIRQSDSVVKTLAVRAAGQNIGSVTFIQSKADTKATLRMGSDLTLHEGNLLPRAGAVAPPPAGSTVTYEIDTAGYTLNLLGNKSAWKPDAPRNVKAVWLISGGGTVIANGFDFSAAGVTVTVAPGTTLKDATGKVIQPPQ